MGLLQGLEHGAVAELHVAAEGDALRKGCIPAGSKELPGEVKRNGRELGGMDRLAQARFSRQGQARQTPHQLQQATEVAVLVRPHLAVDQGGLEDAAGHLQAMAGGQQLIFCTAEPCHQLAIEAIGGKALGDGGGGRTGNQAAQPCQTLRLAAGQLVQEGCKQPDGPKTDPDGWGTWLASRPEGSGLEKSAGWVMPVLPLCPLAWRE